MRNLILLSITVLTIGISTTAHSEPGHCKFIPPEVYDSLTKYDAVLDEYQSLMAEIKYRARAHTRGAAATDDSESPGSFPPAISTMTEQMRSLKENIILSLVEVDKNLAPKKPATFTRWLACDSIKTRIDDSDLDKPSIQSRMKLINQSKRNQKHSLDLQNGRVRK